MKLLSIAGLALGTCLVSFAPLPVFAEESQSTDITCRAALQDEGFAESPRTEAARPCCYVVQETDWYRQYDVLLQYYYHRDSGDIVLTLQCQSNDGGLSTSASSSPRGNDGDDSSSSQPPDADSSSVSSSSIDVSSSASVPSSSDESSSEMSSTSSASGDPPLSSSEEASSSVAPPPHGSGGNGCNTDEDSRDLSGDLTSALGASSTSSDDGDDDEDCRSSSSDLPSTSSQELGNPGNALPVGHGSETPNGDVSGFKPDPGTKGKSD